MYINNTYVCSYKLHLISKISGHGSHGVRSIFVKMNTIKFCMCIIIIPYNIHMGTCIRKEKGKAHAVWYESLKDMLQTLRGYKPILRICRIYNRLEPISDAF